MNSRGRLFRSALLGLCCAALSWAQAVSTAQIGGTVQDASGSAVPGAEVKAVQTETGAVRTVTSGPDGGYVMPSLPVGRYQLEVSKEGFSRYVQTGIVLQVASNPTIDINLKVGAVSEQVQVEANAAQVETQNTGIGQVIDSQRVVDLPLVGRQVTDLIVLSGGAVTGTTSVTTNFYYPNTTQFSIAGGVQQGTTFVLDGAMHNDVMVSAGLPLPFPDALQEFKVETSSLPAQYGFHSGGAVNAVTKSGSNAYHGAAFEFLRNYDANARQFFAKTKDYLKRNQFGGTFGGPIRKNRLFFFAGYQQTNTRQSPAATNAFVPTPAMISGDFSTFAGPSCNSGRTIQLKDPLNGAPFAGNQIPVARLVAPALKISSQLPQATNACGLTQYGIPNSSDERFGVGKVDYQFTPTHSLFVRYLGTHFDQAIPYDLSKNLLATTNPGVNDFVQALTIGDTYLLGSNIVNSFRATFDRIAIAKIGASFFNAQDVGINMYSYLLKFASISVTGTGFNIGGLSAPSAKFRTTVLQFGDDLNIIKGKHQISIGANLSGWQSNTNANTYSMGFFTINGQATGAPLADFLTGNIQSLAQGAPNILYVKQNYFGLYAQDSWKLRPGLTVNYGVRWEPYFPQKFGNHDTLATATADHFDLGAFIAGQKSTQFTNAPAGMFYPGDAGFPGREGQYKQWKDLAPRVGLVWDPTGTGKMSIRASYGIFYDLMNVQLSLANGQGPPWGGKVNPINPPGGLVNPYQGIGGDPFPFTFGKNAPFPQFGTFDSFIYNTRVPYVQQWNLSVQRQLGSDWLISATYLGNEMVHLFGAQELNPGVYMGTGACAINGINYPVCSTTANENQRRKLNLLDPKNGQYYGFIDQWDDGGTNSYNGLLLSAQKRYSRNFTVTANYTWSHCIGDPVNVFLQTQNGGGGVYQYPTRAGDRSNCIGSAIDQRHTANMTAVAEMPKFSEKWMQMFASGWRASTTVTLGSGSYSSIITGIDGTLTGKDTLSQPADQMLPNVGVAPGTPSKLAISAVPFLNPAAFANPATGKLGNMGPATIQNPGNITVNSGLSRLFKIQERHTIEVRAEAQNLLNRANFNAPVNALNNGNFGYLTSTGPARVMQFALKYLF